jgi:anaerobic selenocysteine-containing dehydrogenase
VVGTAAGRLCVRCKAGDTVRRGQLVLPHGYGQAFPAADGERLVHGPRINLLTQGDHDDPVARTPYRKHVAVRLGTATADEAAACQARSMRVHAK